MKYSFLDCQHYVNNHILDINNLKKQVNGKKVIELIDTYSSSY